MWYVADLLFARPKQENEVSATCETSLVLLEAPTAREAYAKALSWAERHEEEEGQLFSLQFVGVQHLYSLEEEQPGDGSEIGGGFYESEDVWERRDELIPQKEEIPVIRYEAHPDSPMQDLMSEKQQEWVRRVLRE
jgi:Domain of unknown function (DUF4288)